MNIVVKFIKKNKCYLVIIVDCNQAYTNARALLQICWLNLKKSEKFVDNF